MYIGFSFGGGETGFFFGDWAFGGGGETGLLGGGD